MTSEALIGRRALAVGSLAAALPLGARGQAQTQTTWPERPVRCIVAFPPAGPVDIVGRIVGDRLGALWGQPAIIENRGGAGGNVGAQFVAHARPDGYVALLTSSAFAVNPSLYRNTGYRPEELAVAALLADSPNVLAVRSDSPARTLAEFLVLARQQPMNFGSAGTGTTPHLSAERILNLLGHANAQHIPFSGAGPAATALLAGQVEIASVALPAAVEFIRQGSLRGLCVTGNHRAPSAPGVPTAAESGFPGIDDVTWNAMLFPAGTAPAVLEKCNRDVATALRDPAVRQRLDAGGFEPMSGSVAEADAYVRREIRRWAEVVRAIGTSLD